MRKGMSKVGKMWLVVALAVTFVTAPSAMGLTILRNFISSGNSIPGQGVAGNAPGSAVGGGNLIDIFNAAADWWQLAILDAHAVTINYGWAPLGGGTLGGHSLITQGGAPNRETQGSISFDNDGSSVFFLDPTPNDNSEYTTFTPSTQDFGGGVINSGRVYTGPTGFAVGRTDLFSVALHEIGHALGLSSANTAFQAGNGDLDVDVMAPRPFPGSVLPTISGAHLNIGSSLMFPSIGTDVRRIQSGADILANAEISQFNNINLNPEITNVIPEPASASLMLVVGASLMIRRRQRAA